MADNSYRRRDGGAHGRVQQNTGGANNNLNRVVPPVSGYSNPAQRGRHASPAAQQTPRYPSYEEVRRGRPQGQQPVDTRNASDAYFAQSGTGYSRNEFTIPKKKKASTLKRVLLGILIALLTVVLAVSAVVGVYMFQLDGRLDSDANAEHMKGVLTPAGVAKPFYVLLLGSDSREGSGTSSNPAMSGDQERSDVMMLARVDAAKRTVTLVSIPRDTPYVKDGTKMKINEAYNIGGAKETLTAVKKLTGVPISHYVEVHLSGLQNIVDILGGVEMNVPVDMQYWDALTGEWVYVDKGKQILNGQEVQIVARSRKQYEGNQDAARQDSNRQLVGAIANRLLSKPPWEIPSLVLDLAEYVDTDIHSLDVLPMAVAYGTGQGKMKMYSCTGPTDGGVDEATGLWLCYEDPQGWASLMAKVDAGQDPNK